MRWGTVDELMSKLPISQTRGPFFLYAHIITPHPPIRTNSDCSPRGGGADLMEWNPSAKKAFIGQLECANSQALQLINRITEHDPDAIIVLQSDHGTAFRGQFGRPLETWDSRDIEERTGVLNAMRLPKPCQSLIDPSQTLINTFPVVLTCVSGQPVPRQEDNVFITQYNDSPEYRKFREVSRGH